MQTTQSIVDSIGGSPNIQNKHQPLLSMLSNTFGTVASTKPTQTCPAGVCPHQNCLISAIRGARQGLYYGGKVRFAHSLVM